MKVHSVVSLDITPDEPIDGTVIGTFHDRKRRRRRGPPRSLRR